MLLTHFYCWPKSRNLKQCLLLVYCDWIALDGVYVSSFQLPVAHHLNWELSVWYEEKKRDNLRLLPWGYGCSCWSTWDLQVLTTCWNERGRVRTSSVPRRLNGFWNPFNPTQSLQQGKDRPIHYEDVAGIWAWTREGGGWGVTRTRSSAGAWRRLISNTLSH